MERDERHYEQLLKLSCLTHKSVYVSSPVPLPATGHPTPESIMRRAKRAALSLFFLGFPREKVISDRIRG